MKTTLKGRSLASIALAGLVFTFPSCEGSEAFIERASAQGWYLVSSDCFYRLDEYVGCLLLPEPAAEEPIDYRNSHDFFAFDLSTDGSRIVAESYNRETPVRSPHLVIYDERMATVVEDEDLGRSRGYAPYRWSPDGRYVSFAHGSEVRVLDVDKGVYRTVATDHAPVKRDGPPYGTPTWSAESKQLTYQTHDREIAIVDVKTGKTERVGTGCVPSWSPDGSKIAFLEDSLGRRDALVYHTGTGRTETLFKTGFRSQLIWSPDSQFLVFSSPLLNSRFGDMRVYSFETAEVTSTGRQVASIREAQIEALPEWFTRRLRERADRDRENPNR